MELIKGGFSVGKMNSDDVTTVKTSTPFLIILILGALAALGPLNNDMYLPAFPNISKDFETTASLVQLSLTSGLFGLAIGQVVSGALSDVYGRRKPVIIALLLFAITSLLCSLAPSIWSLIILRIIQGAAGGAGVVISRACIRDLYSGSEMTKALSVLVLIMGVAPILAPIAGGLLLNFVSWRGVFIALCVIGLLIMVAAFRLPETLPKSERTSGGLRQTITAFKHLIKDRLFLGYALIMGFTSGAMFAYISGSPFVLQEIYHLSPQAFSVCFGVNAMGIIIASQITGRLAARYGESRFLIIGLSMQLLGGVLLLSVTILNAGLFLILLALFLVVSSIGFINPSGTTLAMESLNGNVGSASALIGLISFGIGGIVAPLVGALGSQTAVPLGVVVAICAGSAMFIYQFMIRRRNLVIEQQLEIGQD